MQTTTVNAPRDYRVLAERVLGANLLERHSWRYAIKAALTIGAFAGGWVALVFVGNSWIALGVAAYLAVLATQVLFIGHDAGHQQIFNSRRANSFVGLVIGNLFSGLSFGWWVPKHNAHHAHPNQCGRDPDIGPLRSDTTEHAPATLAAQRLVRSWRVIRLVPIVALDAGMHLTSAKSLIKRRGSSSLVEWLLIAVHAVLYLAVVFWVLSPSRALAFIAIQQGLFGLYLRVSFAPNHKGMPTLTYDSKMSFLDRQVLTSRNVSGGRPITFLLGGLNYQIEHHLFPTMPRRNLSRAQPIVRAFCREVGLEYRQDSIAASYQGAFRSLRKSAAPTRPSDEVNLALAALWQKTP